MPSPGWPPRPARPRSSSSRTISRRCRRASGTRWCSRAGGSLAEGSIGDVLTDAALTAAYGIPLRVARDAGRWTARRS